MKEIELAENKTLLKTAAAAEYLGVSPGFLRRDRKHDQCIPFIQEGRQTWYHREVLEGCIKHGVLPLVREVYGLYAKHARLTKRLQRLEAERDRYEAQLEAPKTHDS